MPFKTGLIRGEAIRLLRASTRKKYWLQAIRFVFEGLRRRGYEAKKIAQIWKHIRYEDRIAFITREENPPRRSKPPEGYTSGEEATPKPLNPYAEHIAPRNGVRDTRPLIPISSSPVRTSFQTYDIRSLFGQKSPNECVGSGTTPTLHSDVRNESAVMKHAETVPDHTSSVACITLPVGSWRYAIRTRYHPLTILHWKKLLQIFKFKNVLIPKTLSGFNKKQIDILEKWPGAVQFCQFETLGKRLISAKFERKKYFVTRALAERKSQRHRINSCI